MSSNFIVKFFNAISNGIVNNNVLNRSIHTGVMDVPYASMGLITIAVGTFTYVTYTDYISDIGNNISETIDDVENSPSFEYNQENDNSEPMGFLSSLGISKESDEPEIQNNSESNDEPINEKNEEEPEKEEEKKEETEQKEETEKKEEKEKEQPGEQYSLGGKSKSRKSKNKKRRKITNKKRR